MLKPRRFKSEFTEMKKITYVPLCCTRQSFFTFISTVSQTSVVSQPRNTFKIPRSFITETGYSRKGPRACAEPQTGYPTMGKTWKNGEKEGHVPFCSVLMRDIGLSSTWISRTVSVFGCQTLKRIEKVERRARTRKKFRKLDL